MKKIIYLFFLLASASILCAQPIWNTLIVEPSANDGIIKMIKTNDGGFAVLLGNSKPLNLYKFNAQGDLIWEKEHDFNTTASKVYPRDMVELPNGNFAIIGSVDTPAWYQFLFIADSEGDSLEVFTYPEYSFFRNLTLGNNELFCIGENSDTSAIIRLSIDGNIVENNKIQFELPIQFSNHIQNNIIDVENQRVVTFWPFNDTIAFYHFSLLGELELKKSYYTAYPFGANTLLSNNTDGHISAYDRSIYILDEEINLLHDLPDDNDNLNFSQTTWQLWPEQVLATSDGGFLLTGYAWNPAVPFWLSKVYMIKLDDSYEIEWKHLFTDPEYLPLNSIPHIVEVDDGYVFVGIREDDFGNGQTWIVKVNKEGIYTATEEVISESSSTTFLKIYPNPCFDNINITFPENWTEKEMFVYDGQGRLVLQQYVDETELNLDVSNLASGLYYVKVVNRSGNEKITSKFIKI